MAVVRIQNGRPGLERAQLWLFKSNYGHHIPIVIYVLWSLFTKRFFKTGQFCLSRRANKSKTSAITFRQTHCLIRAEISESLDGVSVSTSFTQSRPVSVLTSIKFSSLDESRSRHPRNFSLSMSLSLDIQENLQSRWVSVSTSKKFLSLDESRSRHPINLSVSMSLNLDIHKVSKSLWVIQPRKAKQKESNATR